MRRFGALASLLWSIAVVAPSPAAAEVVPRSVSYQGGMQHQGVVDDPSIQGDLHIAWRTPVPGTASYAVIGGGRVFVTVADWPDYGSRLMALDESTGAVQWSAWLAHNYWGSYPLYDAGRVIVMDTDAHLRAFDAATGTPLWTTAAGESTGGMPVTAGGLVLVTAYDYRDPSDPRHVRDVSAIDEVTGRYVWVAQDPVETTAPIPLDGNLVIPMVACGSLDAFSLSDGTNLRPRPNDEPCSLTDGVTTASDGRNVVAATTDREGSRGLVFTSTGALVRETTGVGQGPAIAGDSVVFTTPDGLRTEDLQTGALRWAVDWRVRPSAPALVIGRRVYTETDDGVLHVTDLVTGARAFDLKLDNGPFQSLFDDGGQALGLSAGDGQLIVPTWNGVMALRADHPPPVVTPPATTAVAAPKSPVVAAGAPSPRTRAVRIGVTAVRSISLTNLRRNGLRVRIHAPDATTGLRVLVEEAGHRLASRTWQPRRAGSRTFRLRLTHAARHLVKPGRATLTVGRIRGHRLTARRVHPLTIRR